MAFSRKQAVTCISIVYLIIITAVAGYAASRASKVSLPIPEALSGLTTVLPIVAGLLLEVAYDLTRASERKQGITRGDTPRPSWVLVANTIIFIYSSVVITLLGTYAAPESELSCKLDRRWNYLFAHKKDESIRTIQDAFKCCGYKNSHDQAWPFPDKSHNIYACENAFGRKNGCLEAWKGEEKRIAGILMGMVAAVFVWQMFIIIFPMKQETWLHRMLPDSINRLTLDRRQQGLLDYVPTVGEYRDEIQDVDGDEEQGTGTIRRAIEGGAQNARSSAQNVRSVFPGGDDEEQHDAPTENTWARF